MTEKEKTINDLIMIICKYRFSVEILKTDDSIIDYCDSVNIMLTDIITDFEDYKKGELVI